MSSTTDTPVTSENDSPPMMIGGLEVFFPTKQKPFPAQLALMSKILQAMKTKKNGLLESPTGTGKTLAFLTSSLAFQDAYRSGKFVDPVTPTPTPPTPSSKPTPNTTNIPNTPVKPVTTPSTNNDSTLVKPDPIDVVTPPTPTSDSAVASPTPSTSSTSSSEKSKPPKIFFCSRTHSQLHQVIDELRNCHPKYTSTVRMTTFGSRKQLCVNDKVQKAANPPRGSRDTPEPIENLCRDEQPCFYNRQSAINYLNSHLQSLRVWDIEDLTENGKSFKACSYFASRMALDNADLVFAPYAYILDPSVREAVGLDIKNSIIIFDEAHNIDDVSRESGSLEISHSSLLGVRVQLARLAEKENDSSCERLRDFCDIFLRWMDQRPVPKSSGVAVNSGGFHSTGTPIRGGDGTNTVWNGIEFASSMEQDHGLSFDSLLLLRESINIIVDQLQEREEMRRELEEDGMELENEDSGMLSISAALLLKSFVSILLLALEPPNQSHYRFTVQEKAEPYQQLRRKRGRNNMEEVEIRRDSRTISFCIWLLHPGVIFRSVSSQARSVLLTSGTLSPLDSFASELETEFPVRVETNHVIDLQNQLLGRVASSFCGQSLNSVFANQQEPSFQDTLGHALLYTVRNTPGGVLMFLPSFSLLSRLEERWGITGFLRSLEADTGARVFFEPRDASELSSLLPMYYDELSEKGSKAVFVAVCRGKVSEGINFSDHYARAVLLVGIPYPSTVDLKVQLKRAYQDKRVANELSGNYQGMRGAIDGGQWYRLQAFRAINQAVGRCIRHRSDFGAVLLLDPRHGQPASLQQLSKWLRGSVQVNERFEDSLVELRAFFREKDSYSRVEAEGSDPSGNLNQLQKEKESRRLIYSTLRGKGVQPRKPVQVAIDNSRTVAPPIEVIPTPNSALHASHTITGFFERVAPPPPPVETEANRTPNEEEDEEGLIVYV